MATLTPAWGPKDKHRLINTRLPRVDAPFKATGTAKYTYDVNLPGMLYARILRCPYPRARVTSIDVKPAMAIAGVVAAVESGHTEISFEGDPVAAVAATTLDLADDGIHAIEVKYEVLPHSVTAPQAIAPGAAAVFPNDATVQNNMRAARKTGNLAAVTDALAKCDSVVEAEYRTPTLHHTCLETHGVVVDYTGGKSATIYCSTQGAFSIPRGSGQYFGISDNDVTGIVQYMGGGFGAKGAIGIEGILACKLSKMANVPVKLMLNRKDEFVMAGNGGASWQIFKAGVNKDGSAIAMQVTQHPMGGVGRGSLQNQPYTYKFQTVYNETTSIHTNVDANRPLRAPGSPPACFAMESLMDELAYKIGMDPVEFRKKNFPTTTAPARADADAWIRQLDRGAKEIGWERRNPVAGGNPGTLKRGFGCAVGSWAGGGRAGNIVNVTVTRDGKVTASIGTQDLGTGTRTYIVAIVAEELGLEMADVDAEIGSTKLGYGSNSGGSSTAPSVAPVVKSAAFKARAEIAKAVAPLLGAQPDDVVFDNRSVSGNGKTLSWSQACLALPANGVAVQGDFIGSLASTRTRGASFAEVEVDTETGHVRPIRLVHVQDCGLPLNRLAVESQINGGMVQGVGMALLEGAVLDERTGFMLNSSFMDYKIAGCLEMPEFVPLIDDGDERNMVVGMGEPPSIPPAAAIANAIFNACGVRVRDLPITPDKILMGLMAKTA